MGSDFYGDSGIGRSLLGGCPGFRLTDYDEDDNVVIITEKFNYPFELL